MAALKNAFFQDHSHLLRGLKRLLQALIKWEGHSAMRLVLQKENCPGDTQGISQFLQTSSFIPGLGGLE